MQSHDAEFADHGRTPPRVTPIKKSVDFNKYELRALIGLLQNSSTYEPEIPEDMQNICADLFNRLKKIESNWEDEAHQNGEFF